MTRGKRISGFYNRETDKEFKKKNRWVEINDSKWMKLELNCDNEAKKKNPFCCKLPATLFR